MAALAACRTACDAPVAVLRAVADDMQSAMRVGLAADGQQLRMLPTFVTRLPSGAERGSWYALDLGGTNFRVLRAQLGEAAGEVTRVESCEVAIPAPLLRGRCAELFAFIAQRVVAFTGPEADGALGFTFSFACAQEGLDSGKLLVWTKGFALLDGPGLDVVHLLRTALYDAGSRMRVAVLANDTVGTLAAAHYADPAARVAVILGTGTNAAYLERCSRVAKWPLASSSDSVVINIEWGALAAPSLPRLAADQTVDEQSVNRGEQTFEKMIAGMYLGKIAALTLLQMDAESGELFTASQREALLGGGLSTPLLSQLDNAADSAQERSALASALGSAPSDAALAAAKEVCHLVTRRAARLAAAAIYAVLTHSDAASTIGGTPPIVAVDGGLFEHHAAFAATLREAVAELGANAVLRLTVDGSGIGAALLAAAAQVA